MSGMPGRKRHPLAVALMGLLMLAFLILGVGGSSKLGDIFAGAHGDAVVIAGQHVVTTREFKRIYEQQKRSYEEQTHQPLTLEFLVQSGGDQQILSQMAQDRAFSEMLRRSGVTPGDSLVDEEIKRQPTFFDRVTGKFSPEQFTRALSEAGLTPRDLQAGIKDELAQRHLAYAVDVGFRVPRIYAALNAVRGLENRDVSYFTLGQDAVPKPAPPTDAQLLAFIKEHADRLTIPETRIITLAVFSAKALAPTITLDPAAVQKEFDFKKDSLSKPETRSLVQIPVKTAAQGAQAAARLAKGESADVVAKAYGAEPITYADKPLSAIADRKLGAAAFVMKNGEAKGPIQGDLGLAAVKITAVTPGAVADLASARPQIEADLRTKTALDKVYDITQKFDDLREGGASVADAARQVGVATMSIGPVAANGMDLNGQRNPLLTDKILKSAFDQSAGGETDLEEADRGESYALKVDKILPPTLPSLADKRAELTGAYMRAEFIKALQAKVDALMARIRKGETIDAVAASVGGHVTHQVGLQAVTAQQHQELGQDFLGRLFNSKPGDVFAANGQQGVFVARLDAVRPGDINTMARIVESIRGRASEAYVKDLDGAVRDAAAKTVKVTTNLDLARRTLGVDPATLPKAGSKPAAKPAAKAASGGLAQ